MRAGGEVLPGEQVLVEGRRYWRPEERVPSGTLLEFAHEGCEGDGDYDSPFQVRVEGRWLPPQLDFVPALSLVLDEDASAEVVSCGVDEALLVEAGYCDCPECECAFPEPGEATVALSEAWRGGVQWFDATGAVAAGQVLVRQLEWFGEPSPESDWRRLDHWAGPSARNVEVAEGQLCTSFEILVVPTDERTELVHCVDPPPEPLSAQPVVARFDSFLGIEACTLPPEGYGAAWCERYQRDCGRIGASEETQLLCRHHYELCGSEPPGPEPGDIVDGSGGGFASGGSSGGSSTGGASRGGASATRCGGETDPVIGCSAAPSPGSIGGVTVVGLLLLLGCAGLASRRRGPCGTTH